MKIICKISGFFFLMSLFLFGGCKNAESGWDHVYRTDAEDVSVSTETDQSEVTEIKKNEEGSQSTIWVHVCGAVKHPGVYELPEGVRIVQVIEAAGGLTDEADLYSVNQARLVADGEQIRIYTKEEAAAADLQEEHIEDGSGKDGKINLNRASAEQLMTLPGIGEAKAEAIISYREELGGFDHIEDIMNISGIKEAVFSRIRDKITV